MIASIPSSALAGIESGQAMMVVAADHIAHAGAAHAGAAAANAAAAAHTVSLSGGEVLQAAVDLRLARYQVVAAAATLRTYDEVSQTWLELAAPRA